jgi:hypothetical protein
MHYQTMSMSYQHHIVTRLFSHDRVCGVSTKLCQSISIQFRYTNVSGAGTRLGGPNIGGEEFLASENAVGSLTARYREDTGFPCPMI